MTLDEAIHGLAKAVLNGVTLNTQGDAVVIHAIAEESRAWRDVIATADEKCAASIEADRLATRAYLCIHCAKGAPVTEIEPGIWLHDRVLRCDAAKLLSLWEEPK